MKTSILILLLTPLILADEPKVFRVSASDKVDSYLDAYEKSHGEVTKGLDKMVNKSDREYIVEPQGYPVYKPLNGQYGRPVDSYGPLPSGPSGPGPQYGPPAPQYGPPLLQYGPPAQQYGPPVLPVPQYSPPALPQYGPPPPSSVQVFYGMPHAMLSIWDKLKWKLDLFTVGKILLKLVIFKKIVSLIAILCLLLFIPSLKHKKLHHDSTSSSENDEENDMLMRTFKIRNTKGDQTLDNISVFILDAIKNFGSTKDQRKSFSNCESTYCKAEKIAKKLNKKLAYQRLEKLYT